MPKSDLGMVPTVGWRGYTLSTTHAHRFSTHEFEGKFLHLHPSPGGEGKPTGLKEYGTKEFIIITNHKKHT